MTSGRRRLEAWFGEQHLAAWVVSGVGLVLAGLSLWYLIVVKALYLGAAVDDGPFGLLLKVIEVALLAGFSLVLVYAGYWLASSHFEERRLWWAGLWTMIGLAGIVGLVALATSFQVLQGQRISQPTLIQEMLLAAGGGALAGLLIGLSTIRETVEAEQARRHHDTLLFVNELLRHNVLNGMQIILGNTAFLYDHVDDEGEQLLATNEERAEGIVELIQNVRVLVQSVSGETPLQAVSLEPVVRSEVHAAAATYPDASVEADVPTDIEVRADELLDAVFENLIANAVEHTDGDATVRVTVEGRSDRALVRVADDGPGIPPDERARLLEAGERGVDSAGQGLGLYLVATLVDRYDGDVRIEDNDPRGTVVSVELRRAD